VNQISSIISLFVASDFPSQSSINQAGIHRTLPSQVSLIIGILISSVKITFHSSVIGKTATTQFAVVLTIFSQVLFIPSFS
jgi:phospholipase C